VYRGNMVKMNKILIITLLSIILLCGFKGQYEYRKQINCSKMLDIEQPMLINGARGFNLTNETHITNYKCLGKPNEYLFLYFNTKGDFTLKECGKGFFGWLCRLTKGKYFLIEAEYELIYKAVYSNQTNLTGNLEKKLN